MYDIAEGNICITAVNMPVIYPFYLLAPSASPTNLRPSKHESEGQRASQAQALVMTVLKNSHYNEVHFDNPDFQPEQWTPESEEPTRIEKVWGIEGREQGRKTEMISNGVKKGPS
jgi:hypothetical protein